MPNTSRPFHYKVTDTDDTLRQKGVIGKNHWGTERTGAANELRGWLLTTLSLLGSELMNPLAEMWR